MTTLTDAATNTEGANQQPVSETSAPPAANTETNPTETQDNSTLIAGADTPPAETAPSESQPPKEGEPTKDNEAGETKPEDKKAEETKIVPEKYELKLAEGVQLSPEVQTQFETVARELGLPQEAAQKLIDLAPEFGKMYTSQLIETAQKTSQKWKEEALADQELSNGGDKAAFAQNLALVAKARNAFATPELNKLLDTFNPQENPNGTGLGNHPELVRFFLRIGKSISEDNKLVVGSQSTPTQSAADRLYGNKPKS